MTPREKFTPEGAVLSQVLAGNSHPGASVLRVWQFGILKPQTTIRYAIVCYSRPGYGLFCHGSRAPAKQGLVYSRRMGSGREA
jgi:hypothetical protein